MEGSFYESLSIQYMTDTGWEEHTLISPYHDLPTLKAYPRTFTFLFPKNTNRVRFYATHDYPSGDRNKGRILLDNFFVEYNV